jgi:hypothetical protein
MRVAAFGVALEIGTERHARGKERARKGVRLGDMASLGKPGAEAQAASYANVLPRNI